MTHFVAGIGTSGTVMGAGRYLKSRNPAIKVIAVEPDDPMHGLEGLKHMATSIVPGIYHERELDDKIPGQHRRRLRDGLRAGPGRGHPGRTVLRRRDARRVPVAQRARSEGCVVTIFPDFGDKYLSTNLWIGWQAWRRERLPELLKQWNA